MSLSAQWFQSTGVYDTYNTNQGKVGIGVNNPASKLDVRTAGAAANDQNALNVINPSTLSYAAVQIHLGLGDGSIGSLLYAIRDNATKASTTCFWNTDNNGTSNVRMQIFGNGNGTVSVGTPSATFPNLNYKFDVDGTAHANKIVVTAPGADYVFDSSYRLTPLAELADSIRTNHHLPGIAPASEMQKEGIDVGDNQSRLLAKVEELTLYIIKQNERMDTFNQQLETLKKQNELLQEQTRQLQEQNQRLKAARTR